MALRAHLSDSAILSGMKVLAAVVTTLGLLAAACGDPADTPPEGDATAVATATPEVAPFTVVGPRDQAAAFSQGEWGYFSALVLDMATGEVYTIDRTTPTAEGPYVGPIQWVNDNALVTYDGYRIELSGGVSSAAGPVATTTPNVMPDVPESADGLWSAERNLAISGITVTERATERRFDVPNTDDYQWAPAGHLIATGGGWCGGGRVSIVDPAAGTIMQITPGGSEGHGVVYVWRPDGLALALDLFNEGQALVLVDATTGEMTTLIDPPEYVGEFVPLEWNPSGTHLLFRIHGGRDCSN